jgi:hypothetical protein
LRNRIHETYLIEERGAGCRLLSGLDAKKRLARTTIDRVTEPRKARDFVGSRIKALGHPLRGEATRKALG